LQYIDGAVNEALDAAGLRLEVRLGLIDGTHNTLASVLRHTVCGPLQSEPQMYRPTACVVAAVFVELISAPCRMWM
jgi:hypothetical protein